MPPLARSLPALAALVLVALALRPQVIGIGPLLPAIREDLGMSHGVAGLLGTIPVLCMGLFAPLGPHAVRRLGPRLAIAACVLAIVGFGLLRAVAPGPLAVLAVTFGIGLGMGTIGPVLTMVVRLRVPHRPAMATGAYASGIVLGATLAAALAVPLASGGSDWRGAFTAFSLAGLGSVGAWLVLARPDRPEERVAERPPALPWRSTTAWSVALVFGLQSILYYGVVSWLPNVYVERGWSQSEAAGLVALLHGAGMTMTIGLPLVADRLGSRRAQLVSCGLGTLAGSLGLGLAPDLAILWAVVLGLALGAVFPLALTLPVDVAGDARDVGATAALMLLVGYVLASLGPVAMGLARDATGDFRTSLWLLVGLAASLVASCGVLSPGRLRRGVRRGAGFPV